MKEVWQTYTDTKKNEPENNLPLFKTYNVALYSPSYSYISSALLIVLFIVPIIAGRLFSINGAVVLFIIMVLGLLFALKRMKDFFTEQKEIDLYGDKLIIKGKESLAIPFDNIKDYNIAWAKNAVNVIIRLKSGGKVKLGYSGFYGDTGELEKLITDFETRVNKPNLTGAPIIRRKKSWIESPWMIALLIILTIMLLVDTGLLFYLNKPVPLGIWLWLGFASLCWSFYITTRNRNRGILPTNNDIMDLHRQLNKDRQ